MKIQKTFNTTEEEIKSKKFNIFIGISLGNKWFTKENLREYLGWVLKNTKESILVLIADEIHAVNYNARNKQGMESALKKSLREGDKIYELLLELIEGLGVDDGKKIEILRWGELENTHNRLEILSRLKEEFNKKEKFYDRVIELIKEHSSKEGREFSDSAIEQLANYVINEIPEFLRGISTIKADYNLYVYPKDGPYFNFMQRIQNGEIFQELNKSLPIKKIAYAVVN